MKMMGPSIGDACPETCAGGKISGATVVAGNSIVPTFKTTIKMTGDCDAFDVAVAAAKLAAQLGVDMGQVSMVKDCGGGRRRRLTDEFTVDSEVVVPEGNEGVTAETVAIAAESEALTEGQDGDFAVTDVGEVTLGMKVVDAPSPPPAMPPPPPSPSPPPMCATECGIFSNGADKYKVRRRPRPLLPSSPARPLLPPRRPPARPPPPAGRLPLRPQRARVQGGQGGVPVPPSDGVPGAVLRRRVLAVPDRSRVQGEEEVRAQDRQLREEGAEGARQVPQVPEEVGEGRRRRVHEQEGEAQVPGVVRHARLLKGPLHIPPKILIERCTPAHEPLNPAAAGLPRRQSSTVLCAKVIQKDLTQPDPDCAIDPAALGACRVGRALVGR